ncbi:hypothetical protein NQ314_017956 [Rhamnusium bicolor]|uniref:SIAH-type domain-containing protein n=1 Tax=Rhamnusium bicolor TaxID=1586634 RepID=A0AAV8WTK6_9CUCU|nr:hypothetical protein NQ314_017956 [Rhamnusium bicolor]
MDNIVLSDKVLSQQICTKCLNYLSVGPVLVSRGGKILCGRCSNNSNTTSNVLKYSLYNLVAEKLIFKCINHYVGCEKLLLFNETIEHEKDCKEVKLKCHFCNYEGNGCQLRHHFDNEHPNFVMKDDAFKINFEIEHFQHVIFIKDSCILCIAILMETNLIKIFSYLARPRPKYFALRFFTSDSNLEMKLVKIQCSSKYFPFNVTLMKTTCKENPFPYYDVLKRSVIVDCFPYGCFCEINLINDTNCALSGEMFNYYMKIVKEIDTSLPSNPSEMQLQEAINKEDYYIGRISKMGLSALRKFILSDLNVLQTCVNCKKYVTTAVYVCPKYHIACKTCKKKKCSRCKMFCQWNNRSKLHNISLPCEWNGCSISTNVFDYALHKRDCVFRSYKCPGKNCEFLGCLNCLKSHWHLNDIEFESEIDIAVSAANEFAVYWLNPQCKEIFYVTVEVTYNSSGSYDILLAINEVDVVVHKRYEFNIYSINSRQYNSYGSQGGKYKLMCQSFCGKKCNRFVQYYNKTGLPSGCNYYLLLE